MLQFTPSALHLRIEDNGIGFDHGTTDLSAEGHFGLRGMTERAQRLTGGIIINSVPGRATTITVEIPCNHSLPPHVQARPCSPTTISLFAADWWR